MGTSCFVSVRIDAVVQYILFAIRSHGGNASSHNGRKHGGCTHGRVAGDSQSRIIVEV